MALYPDEKQERWEKARKRALDHAPSLTLLADARKVIEYLIDHGNFVPCSKDEFALRMGWTRGSGRAEKPDRRRVENVCNLTRDAVADGSEYTETLGNYVVAYAPSQGGMQLIGDGVEVDGRAYAHLLAGDLQKQQASKTINRRRLAMWKTTGDAFAASGDVEAARLFWQAENEIDATGMVSDTLVGHIFSALVARQVIE